MAQQKINRYLLKAELGRGGMSIVYHAYDPNFNRDVAIKVLPREVMLDPTFRERFRREAQTIAALGHSAIVPVFDFGEHEGQPYLVMAYMSGGSLADRLRQGPLALDEAAHAMDRVASALDAAHHKSIIHRDVKTDNILLDEYGEAYLSDFGIVRLTEAAATLTGTGIAGTPAYMAPEMATLENPTPLVDVYALGVTLFQALTAHLPYNAPTPMGILLAHVTQPIPDARELRPDLPDAVQAVIERAMAKDPKERYASAGEMAADLNAVVSGKSIGARQATPPQPKPMRPALHRRIPTWIWIGGTLLVAGLLALGVFASGGLTTGRQARTLAEAGVTRNADWKPYAEKVDDVLMALVPRGCFMMGSTDEQVNYAMSLYGAGVQGFPFTNEQPAHKVCFEKPFWVDVYEVTQAQFAHFGGEAAQASYFSGDSLPRENITWSEASEFCQTRGMRLPTEAEWEYAARGPDNLIFPWGNEFNSDNVVWNTSQSADVGSKPGGVSWIGAYDLSGNVAEWVNDWYLDTYYGTLADGAVNPQGPGGGTYRVLRGGSWLQDGRYYVRAAFRFVTLPGAGHRDFGFRCARDYGEGEAATPPINTPTPTNTPVPTATATP